MTHWLENRSTSSGLATCFEASPLAMRRCPLGPRMYERANRQRSLNMVMTPSTSQKIGRFTYTVLAASSLLWMAGCAGNTTAIKQEIEVLLKQTMDEVRQETNRMDTEIARIRSEIGQIRSDVGHVDSNVKSLGSTVGQLGSDLALVQSDVGMNNTSLVGLAVQVNQMDRRLAKSEKQVLQNEERVSRPAETNGRSTSQPGEAAVPPPQEDNMPALKHGMTQEEVTKLFGNPHGKERYLDSLYWYYAEGKLKGQYVRFDATTGHVNGWSTFSPQAFQIDLRTTRGGHVR
jgi:archaellum component FlaC